MLLTDEDKFNYICLISGNNFESYLTFSNYDFEDLIDKIPDRFDEIKELTVMANKLIKHIDFLSKFNSLEQLQIEENYNIPTEVFQKLNAMPSLKKISFYDSFKDGIPSGINELSNIEFLFFIETSLDVPDLSNLYALTTIGLYNTNLDTLPKGICTIPNLETICIRSSKETIVFPFETVSLSKLKKNSDSKTHQKSYKYRNQ